MVLDAVRSFMKFFTRAKKFAQVAFSTRTCCERHSWGVLRRVYGGEWESWGVGGCSQHL